MKRVIHVLSIAVAVMFFASCQENATTNPGEDLAEAVAGSYDGYTSASSAMFEDMVNDGEKLVISASGDGTATIAMASSKWGTFEAGNVEVSASGDGYAVKGDGKVSMAMGDAEPKEYDFTVEGTVSSDKKDIEVAFVCPAVMGGLTVVFMDGKAPSEPVEPSENLAEKIAGDYDGYSDASSAMFEGVVTNGEKLSVAANEDGTAKVAMTSSVWGTFTSESVQVSASGEGYSLEGAGKVSMAMGDADPKEYDFTVSGTVTSDKKVELTYTCPAVMGGLTVVFKDGAAPAEPTENPAEKIAGDYDGYSNASCAMFKDKITDGEKLSVAVAGEAAVNVVITSSVWGTFTAENVAVTVTEGTYTVDGAGKVAMSMGGGDPKEYDFTVSGTVTSDKKVELTYTCPAVMGGLTVVFKDGAAPVTE